MKKLILLASIVILTAVFAFHRSGQAAEQSQAQVYEYASVRYMGGGRTCFVWPDGKAEKLTDLNPAKRPDISDDRMFYLTIAMNILAKRGFEPVSIPSLEPHSDDIWVRRLVAH